MDTILATPKMILVDKCHHKNMSPSIFPCWLLVRMMVGCCRTCSFIFSFLMEDYYDQHPTLHLHCWTCQRVTVSLRHLQCYLTLATQSNYIIGILLSTTRTHTLTHKTLRTGNKDSIVLGLTSAEKICSAISKNDQTLVEVCSVALHIG